MIAFSTPSFLKKRNSLPSWPMPIQVSLSARPSISGSVSSRMAATATSAPARFAPSSTRKGNLPLPAIKPNFIAPDCPGSYRNDFNAEGRRGFRKGRRGKTFAQLCGDLCVLRVSESRLLHNPTLRRLDKPYQLVHFIRVFDLFTNAFERLGRVQFRRQQ